MLIIGGSTDHDDLAANGWTLDGDGAVDDLYGDGNNGWFVAWVGDRANDRKNGERLTSL